MSQIQHSNTLQQPANNAPQPKQQSGQLGRKALTIANAATPTCNLIAAENSHSTTLDAWSAKRRL
jgi:hypothetical protein